METALQALLSYQFILFCLGLSAITYVIRLVVQFFILDNPKIPGSRTSAFWKELLLPIAPVVNGGLLGWLVKTSLYPESVTGQAARIFFGLVAGLLSGLVYRVVWGMIKSKLPSGVIGVVVSDAPPQLNNEELSKLTESVSVKSSATVGVVVSSDDNSAHKLTNQELSQLTEDVKPSTPAIGIIATNDSSKITE